MRIRVETGDKVRDALVNARSFAIPRRADGTPESWGVQVELAEQLDADLVAALEELDRQRESGMTTAERVGIPSLNDPSIRTRLSGSGGAIVETNEEEPRRLVTIDVRSGLVDVLAVEGFGVFVR